MMPSSASCGRTARKGGEVDLNGIHLTVWLRRIVTRARFARGLFLWLCLTNVTQLVQLYLYEGLSLPLEGMALLLLEGLLRVAGLSLLLALLCSFLPRFVRRGVAVLSGLLFLVDVFSLTHYHSVLDAGLLQVILATNTQEAVEYMVTQGSDILSMLALASFLTGAFLLYRRMYRRKHTAGQRRLLGNGRPLLLRRQAFFAGRGTRVFSLVLLALFAGSVCHAFADPEDSVEKLPRHLSVGRLVANLKQSYDENRSTAYIDYALASQLVEILEDRHDIPKVIFVLGESTSRHHMQLYGYNLPTTPNLSRREQAGELTAFSSVTSPHAGTMAVMRTLFSFYDKGAAGMWYDYGNLFDILRAAGIHTAWLSNQESSGFYGSIGRTLASRCDEQVFTSHLSHTIDLSERYDEEVLPLLDDALAGDSRTEMATQSDFFVVHLMGAHEDFKRRYPASFARFTAADETGGAKEDAASRQIRAEYDNAVLYDDHIVDAIIQRVEDQDAVVIFLSDHGEEVNDVRELVGHGDESSSWQHDVPMVIWTSTKFRANHAEDVRRIQVAKDHAWQSDEMVHTVLDLLKICVPQYEKEKSLLLD